MLQLEIMSIKYKHFLTKELPEMLRTLEATQSPNFGMMTAHHMVEHLIYVTKVMMKRKGEPGAVLTKSQLYFKNFVENGCPFEYRPKEDAKLSELRTDSIEEAIKTLEEATERFYELFETNPEYKSFTPMTGEFNLEELELFNYQHGRWHAYQFGLIDNFAPLKV